MPSARYVNRPFVPDVYESPNLVRLAELARASGYTQAERARTQGQQSAQGWARLGDLVTNALQGIRGDKQSQAALAQRIAEKAAEEKLQRDKLAEEVAARQAQQQWQRDQFRVATADAAADVMTPGQSVSPAEFTQRFAGTPSAPRFAHDQARAALLPATSMADTGGVPGFAVRPEQVESQPWEPMAAPSMSTDTAARPERYTRQPLFTESLAVENLQRQKDAAAVAARNTTVDNERADAAAKRAEESAKATAAYRAANLRLRALAVANAAAGKSTDFAGDFNKKGDAFLDTIPVQSRATVKSIANYDVDPTKAVSMRGNGREKMMAWVLQVNPDYDQSQFSVRAPTRKAFTTGTQGQQLTAMNTAIEHLEQLQAASDALKNGQFVPGNAAYQRVKELFGSNAPTNYDTIKAMVDKEVEAVANKGIPTVSGTAQQQALAGKKASPEQIKGYIDTLIPLMGSKVNALHYQYQQAMGPNDPFAPLTPEAKRILAQRGFDPSRLTSTPREYLSTDPNFGTTVAPRKPGGG